MLKNAGKYLKKEQERVSSHISFLEEYLESLKRTKAEARALVDSYNVKLTGKEKMFTDMINDILKIMVGYSIINVVFVSLPIIPTISLVLMGIAYCVHLGVNISKYKTAKGLYKDILENLETFDPGGYDGIYDIELNLCSLTIAKIDNAMRELDRETQYLNSIKDILSRVDVNDKGLKYADLYENCQTDEEYKAVLEQEWMAYLDEISRINPELVSLEPGNIPEECYKNSTKKLHYVPDKLEDLDNN
ncbi:MAG: hypothetical protein OSJ70_06350 [Bacilli bacterium]|nr:hypothetical protein [Bacilli bacterium]